MDMIRFAIHFQNDKSLFITNRLNGFIHQIFYRPKRTGFLYFVTRTKWYCSQKQLCLLV